MALNASGAAAGASAGATFGPWGAAIGGVAGALMGGGASSSPAGPSILDAMTDTSVDFSGWTVATHGSSASATNSKTDVPDMASSLLGSAGGQAGQLMMFGIVAVAAIVAIKLFKK